MRIIRIKLANWRGVQASELNLSEGVSIIEGANETGKSSLIEALNHLFRERDSTKKKEMKNVTPKGVDVGSTVEVELKTGQYHFTYKKTFNRKTSTSLHIHAPVMEQLTGVDAHERADSMLDETIDFSLWQAIQLEQGGIAAELNLKSSDSLAQALDAAAGGTGAGEGEALLLDKVKVEYLRYYTERTGKETGELPKLREQVAALKTEIESVTQVLQSMESYIERSEALAAEHQRAAAELPQMQLLLENHQEVLEQRIRHREQLNVLALKLQSQRLTSDGITNLLDQRNKQSQRMQALAVTLATTEKQQRDLQDYCAKSEQSVTDSAAVVESKNKVKQKIVSELQEIESVLQLRDKSQALKMIESQLSKVLEVRDDLDKAGLRVSELLIDRAALEEIENQERKRRELEIRLSAQTPELTIVANKDFPLRVDGQLQSLKVSEKIQAACSAGVTLEFADLATVKLTPTADAGILQNELLSAQANLHRMLQQFGVSSVAEAVQSQNERATLLLQHAAFKVRYEELLDGGSVELLQSKRNELHQRVSRLQGLMGDGSPLDTGGNPQESLEQQQQRKRDQLAELEVTLQAALEAREQAQKNQATADTRLQLATQQFRTDQAAQTTLQAELEVSRAQRSDEALLTDADNEQKKLLSLSESLEKLQQLSALQPVEDAEQLLGNARAALERAKLSLHDYDKERVELRARLDHLQAEGLHEKRELLLAEEDDALARLQQLERSAQAARLLWQTLSKHQHQAQLSYARPLAEQVARMGKLVFGEDFSVQLNPSLAIESRTLNGLTVPFDGLSGGAREQLGIMLRLAAAQLVSTVEGMPLILDDTLGHTDPGRLATMGALLNNAGRHAQIVVLTCYPERYRFVGDATVIKLAEHSTSVKTTARLDEMFID